MPFSPIYVYRPFQHMLESLVDLLHKSIGLKVVDQSHKMLDMQHLTQVCHELGDKGSALVCEHVLGDSNSAEGEYQIPGDVLEHGFVERDGLWVPGGVVDNHQDVFVVPGGLRQQPYEIHAHLLEGDPDDGMGD